MPNGNKISSSHVGYLPFKELPLSAKQVYIFPHLTISLISIGQLCNIGCTAVFNNDTTIISIDNNQILQGYRQQNLWFIDPDQLLKPQPYILSASNIYEIKTNRERIKFYQMILGSPTQQTLYNAVKAGHLDSFPGLTKKLVSKHYQLTAATAK